MRRSERKLQQKKRKKKIWRRIFLTLLLLIMVGIGAIFFLFQDLASDMFQSIGDNSASTSK